MSRADELHRRYVAQRCANRICWRVYDTLHKKDVSYCVTRSWAEEDAAERNRRHLLEVLS